MSLKELLGKMEKTIVFDGIEIKIRPLSLKDIGELLENNSEELKSLFNASKGFKDMLTEMPGLVYKVIQMAIGEDIKDIARLPIGTQLQLLEAVVDASQISSDAMGKLIGRLIKGVQATIGVQKTLTPLSGKELSKEQLESSRKKATVSQK